MEWCLAAIIRNCARVRRANCRGKQCPTDAMSWQRHRARRERRAGLTLRLQGAEPLADYIARVALFRGLGVRVIQLTHNRHNLVGDGCMAPAQAGLSRYGYEVVERLNADKIVVDLAHG